MLFSIIELKSIFRSWVLQSSVHRVLGYLLVKILHTRVAGGKAYRSLFLIDLQRYTAVFCYLLLTALFEISTVGFVWYSEFLPLTGFLLYYGRCMLMN